MNKIIIGIVCIACAIGFSTCELEEEKPTPTRELMQGVWEITEAYDTETGDTITGKTKVLYSGIHLSSDGTVISTAGPLVTYLVYGDSKWTEISSIVDQVFNYANLSFNGGEYFTKDDRVFDRFTLEMKLEGIGGSKSLEDILSIFNIEVKWLKTVVYHKFLNVEIEVDEDNPDYMVWTFDSVTTTSYNTKDYTGTPVFWGGWTAPFRKCKWVLEKRSKSLEELVKEASNK